MSAQPPSRTGEAGRIVLAPLEDTSTFADRAYTALKDTIVSLNVYEQPGEVRLDERQLASDLGISRTPVREAMAQLEREGFVRSVPRRGIYVVRKSKREVIEMITAWAALESMAARLITTNATTDEIAALRRMFGRFENGKLHVIPRMLDTNPFVAFGTHMHGCLTRISTEALLNVTAGGGSTVPTFLVEER